MSEDSNEDVPLAKRMRKQASETCTKFYSGCLFCEELIPLLTNGSTFKHNYRLKSVAFELQDTEMLVKLNSASDIVAMEMKYYKKCFVVYYNRLRNVKSQETASINRYESLA